MQPKRNLLLVIVAYIKLIFYGEVLDIESFQKLQLVKLFLIDLELYHLEYKITMYLDNTPSYIMSSRF